VVFRRDIRPEEDREPVTSSVGEERGVRERAPESH